DGLEKASDHDILAIGHPAFEAAGAVSAAMEPPRCKIVMDGVLDLRAERSRALGGEADLDSFDGLNGDDRLGQFSVEPRIPGDVRSKARWNTMRHDFEDSAHGVLGTISLIDDGLHTVLRRTVDAVEQDLVPGGKIHQLIPGGASLQPGLANLD